MSSNRQKMDAELLDVVNDPKADSQRRNSTRKIEVVITTKESLNSLRDLGVQLQMTFGTMALVEASVSELQEIAELSDVIRMETPKSHVFALDKSTKVIGANQIRTISGNTWSGIATGKGVITAIIDSGINYKHRSFRHADGSTRIIGILDFSLGGTKPHPDGGTRPNITINFGTQPAKINKGVEYNRDNINNALAPGGRNLRHVDKDGHGTHVAGIAAGNGFQRDHCRRFYPGVAPEADILVVKLGGKNSEPHVLLGVAYAIHVAIRDNKGVAINLSITRDIAGAHDGNSVLEKTIDFMLDNHASNKNVSVVTIAGNNADKDAHATGSIRPNKLLKIDFQVSNNPIPKLIEVWYPGAGNNQLGCSIRPPFPLAVTKEVLPQATGNRIKFPQSSGGSIEIASSLAQVNNFQHIVVVVVPPKGQGFAQNVVAQNWRLDLRNIATTGQPIQFHAWSFIKEAKHQTIKFRSHKSRDSTVTIPGTARNVITVGSFEEGSGLSDFSGRGPTIDNRQKPDITAPGEGISAPDSDLPGCCRKFWCACCDVFHHDIKGTSQAAPHVTGAIALMLELNDGLTRNEVRDFLIKNVRTDAATGPNPSNLWGAGKLNVAAAVNAVNATLPTPRTFTSGPIDLDGPSPSLILLSRATWMDLQNRFLKSPGGKFYYALAERYFDETRQLINENKKVATIWHRNDGPLMLRLGLRALAKPDDRLPRKVNDIPVRERLSRIAKIIRRFATNSLVADIEIHLPVLLQLEGQSINQILSFLESEKNW